MEITASEVLEKEENGEELNLIDVREADEIAMGAIPNIIHIPLGDLNNRLNELDKDKEYIIVCRSGARSGVVTQVLTAAGYQAKNMLGGMIDWNGKVIVS